MKKILIIKADNGGYIVKEKAGMTVWKDFPELWNKLSDFFGYGPKLPQRDILYDIKGVRYRKGDKM